jgi:hypothetical protein
LLRFARIQGAFVEAILQTISIAIDPRVQATALVNAPVTHVWTPIIAIWNGIGVVVKIGNPTSTNPSPYLLTVQGALVNAIRYSVIVCIIF